MTFVITPGDILGAAALVVIGLALGAMRIAEWNEKRNKNKGGR